MALFNRKFPVYRQLNKMDCGPCCLRMVADYHGAQISLEHLRHISGLGKEGVSLLGISEASEKIGFEHHAVMISYQQLTEEAELPCIVHFDQNHFVVVTPASGKKKVVIVDPAKGIIKYSAKEFQAHWCFRQATYEEPIGMALLLKPAAAFKSQEHRTEKSTGWRFAFDYLSYNRRYFLQVMLSLLVASCIQLILPFLSQSIVDTGINTRNLDFIYIVLAGQFALFMGRTVVEFIRSRLLLYISSNINISILSDFWQKLMGLPLSFHDTRHTGDILQRINDQRRIESFLTGPTLNVIFSCVNLVVFSFVLVFYALPVFLIFLVGSVLYFIWIFLFLKHRRALDHKKFQVAAKENSATMQLISGMQDIKLNNAEKLKREEWQQLQGQLFNLSFKSLSLNQYQQAGAFFLNEGKNILITFFVARLVLNGELTLGTMVAIQYIIGQLNSPVEQLINFVQQGQDAKLSLERLKDIHSLEDEEPKDRPYSSLLPERRSIEIKELSFSYPGAGNTPVLKDLSLSIPEGKITAIVGMSGSGKTTLLKLLLRFYDSYSGDIKVSDLNMKHLRPSQWRGYCGTVMQDGFIYNDSIAKNIAVNVLRPDHRKLIHACKVANILSFVESLPMGFETKIGKEGIGISQGQRQRLLIARSVYKDPLYIFFDEATNALDANNEKVIMEHLDTFFKNRTVVIVAHRLSTVKNADNIIVLEQGRIIEEGTHATLIAEKGQYYQLVKNQLEIGV